MNDIFVDTSGWACWLDRSLPYSVLSRRLADEVTGQGNLLITTSFIMVELTGLLTSPLRFPKPQQIQLMSALRSDATVEIVQVDQVLEAEAWDLWRSRGDKLWSLVDCVSFIIMQRRQLTQALSTDHHFEQAGFIRLLK